MTGLHAFQSEYGWKDYYLGKNLIFSHRVTTYNMSIFPEKLHYHLFYEMDIYISGKISYISDNREIIPSRGSILIIPPHIMHTAHQSEESEYERYVFYFTPQFFLAFGGEMPRAFLKLKTSVYLEISSESLCEYYYDLNKLQFVFNGQNSDAILDMYIYILHLFVLISRKGCQNSNNVFQLPQNVLNIKSYIDDNLQTISSTSEIATHFFYSREYLSRLFRQYYNINISEYIARRRIDVAKKALESGQRVTDAFQCSGFHTMSSFISVFKKTVHMTPSEYRKHFSDK